MNGKRLAEVKQLIEVQRERWNQNLLEPLECALFEAAEELLDSLTQTDALYRHGLKTELAIRRKAEQALRTPESKGRALARHLREVLRMMPSEFELRLLTDGRNETVPEFMKRTGLRPPGN